MKNRIFPLLLAFILIFSWIFPNPVQANDDLSFSDVLDQRMPELLSKYRVPGAVVSYIEKGEVTWTKTYGFANIKSKQPMSSDMIFNFGSTGKVLTAWGVMRLVEQGKVDLDTPVNQYLKRSQIQSSNFDADGVTLRRLLSHTAGLTVSGFTDYSPRRNLPTLEEMLNGKNQLDGKVFIFQEPGTDFSYSGGGFTVIQMVIEDVTGETFADFMQREIADPLMISSLHWDWTPDLEIAAPSPYGPQMEVLEYRQLASHAIGSELASVPDYARFFAATLSGPYNQPQGRGVLQPESIDQMIQNQPGATDSGLAYGITNHGNGKLLQHFGGNNGWTAFFSLDTELREGLVMATNSSNGFPLTAAVQNLWLAFLKDGSTSAFEPPPATQNLPSAAVIMLGLAGSLTLSLLVFLVIFIFNLRKGKRGQGDPLSRFSIIRIVLWGLALIFWLYWFYTSLPLPFSSSFPDFWRMPQTDLVTIALIAWFIFSLVRTILTKK
jgi:CubicO group peptidase (beta-lactamase class C family)